MSDSAKKDKSYDIGVTSVIKKIREELIALDSERRLHEEKPLFVVESVEIELKCILRQLDGDAFKVDLKVVSYEDKLEAAAERTHTIKILLKTIALSEYADVSTHPVGSLQRKQ